MGLERKAKAAQLSVLSKYGVLADFSALDDTELDRALKGGITLAAAQNMTFATWCDQLLGQGKRVPVARFDGPIAGQTRLSNLAAGHELVKSLKARDKQLQTSLRAAQSEIVRLQSELQVRRQTRAHAAFVEPESEIVQQLRDWYNRTTPPLHRILWEIKEIEGAIFEHQGQLNRDYRKQLVEIILNALADLEHIGFLIDVELRDASSREPLVPSVVLHRSQRLEGEECEREGFVFAIDGVQPDVLEAASEFLWPGRTLPSINNQIRFDCHVSVTLNQRLVMGEDEMFHLSCFVHKLFEAMVRSGDHRPRGTLREKVILCLLLSCTAPCMPVRSQRQELPRLQDIFYRGYSPHAAHDLNTDSNASAGKIVEYLFRILHA